MMIGVAEAVSVNSGVLVLMSFFAPAALTDFLAFSRLIVVFAHLALDSDGGFQFLGRVVPSTSDRCTFVEIKLLGFIGPNQIVPG